MPPPSKKSQKRRRNTSTSPSRGRSPNWKAVKPTLKDRIMTYMEGKAMDKGLMPVCIYMDGRTWRHGSPRRYKKRSPNTRDTIMGYLEGKAMDRGLMPVGIYTDGRTWKHGQPAPYRKTRSSSRRRTVASGGCRVSSTRADESFRDPRAH